MTSSSLTSHIVIAVHTLDRPVARAVKSILSSPTSGAIVVAHGIAAADLVLPTDERIDVLECHDGVGYPAVPFNLGISHATAPLVGIMGSDDWFQEGALQAMTRRLQADRADAVLAPLRHPSIPPGTMPLTLRRKNLQAARDRLFYRTAPLGLFRREILQDPRYGLLNDVHVGEDFQASVRLWTDGLSVSHNGFEPAYVVGQDAATRVTHTPRPLGESLRAIDSLLELSWVHDLPLVDRDSLATKLLRVHIFHAIAAAALTPRSSQEWADLSLTTNAITAVGPGGLRPFTVADRAVLDATAAGDSNAALSAWAKRVSQSLRQRILPDRITDAFLRESNLRHTAATAAVQARARILSRGSNQLP